MKSSYLKMVFGFGLILLGYFICLVIWFLLSSNFYIDMEVTLPIATLFQALSVIPAGIIYFIWYKRLVFEKANENCALKIPLFTVLIALCTTLFLFIPAFIFTYISLIIYLIMDIVVLTGCGLGAMLLFKPFNN